MIGVTVNSASQIQSPAAQPAQVPTAPTDLDGARSQRATDDHQSGEQPSAPPSPAPAPTDMAAYGATGRLMAQTPARSLSILA